MKPTRFLSLLLLSSLLLAACGPAETTQVPSATPPANQSLINTAVAATVASLSKEIASLKASAAAPSPTPDATEKPGGTPSGTAAAQNSQLTPSVRTAGLCDFASFVGDVTVPDGTMVPPNTEFTKIWAIKNTGTCTWTPDYRMIWVGGEPMGSPLTVPMTEKNVAPGETIRVTIKFTAPPDLKLHSSFWKFRNAKGGIFGVIDAQNKEAPIWTQIRTGKVYDFIDNMCLATWKTGGGSLLDCPGDPKSSDGAIYRMNNSQWQDGTIENDPVIVFAPASGDQSTIVGQFPPIVVPEFSRFYTRIGCLIDLPDCSAHIRITYSVDGGPEQNLYETDAGGADVVKVDLNLARYELFKKSTSFLFYVTANGDGSSSKIFFFVPKLAP